MGATVKIKVAVLLGIQGVYEVEAREISPGVYDIMPSLDGEIDIKSTCIAGSTNMMDMSSELKAQIVKEAEQAMAMMVGQNYRPAEVGNKTTPMVASTVN